MSNKEKSKEADEVFEFLDSLPQNAGSGAGTADRGPGGQEGVAGKEGDQQAQGKKDDDIFEFLDELEKSNIGQEKKSEEQPKQEATEAAKEREEQVADGGEGEEEEEEGDELLNDPITSISNWWSSSGSTTVSNLWNKTTEQASQIKERIAKEQQNLPIHLPPININSNTINELAKGLQKIVVGETEEVLRIHLVHDLVNYSYLQYHVEQKFDQVLSDQVQGGIRIFIDEWGKPNNKSELQDTVVVNTDDNNNINIIKSLNTGQRHMNIFTGKISDGEKLAFANLDNAIKLFNKAHDEIVRQQKETNEDNATNSTEQNNISDIFISILPVAVPSSKQPDKGSTDDIITTDAAQPGNFSFTIVLKDITNNVTTITRSQGFPMKWIDWLEGVPASDKNKPKTKDKDKLPESTTKDNNEDEQVDPSEWVQDWIEDGISLVFGIVAQNYVVDRMGFN